MRIGAAAARGEVGGLKIEVGMRVLGISGTLVGMTTRIRPGRFCVATLNGELWLSEESVFTADERGVTLVCAADRAERYRVDP